MRILEATCRCPFGVGVKEKGERFEATQQEAAILVALQRAKYVDDPRDEITRTKIVEPVTVTAQAAESESAATADHVDETPADEPKGEPEPEKPADAAEVPRQKRPYRRRDMQAEK